MHKDSSGHVGFIYKSGKITSLVKDGSAARNGMLTDHYICEINGQNVIGLKVGLILGLGFLKGFLTEPISRRVFVLKRTSIFIDSFCVCLQDTQIKDILSTSPTAMTITIMPKFVYEHMIKK